jgi:hypothetical protein
MQSKGPKVPFFDDTKHSTKFVGQSINKIYNSNTELKYPNIPTIMKFGGGMSVAALSFMKPIKKLDVIYSSKTVWSNWTTSGDNMLSTQFPNSGQKLPAPLSTGNGTLAQVWSSKTNLAARYGTKDTNKIGFGVSTGGDHQKYPAPLVQSNNTLTQIVQAGTIWSFPVNNKKFGL